MGRRKIYTTAAERQAAFRLQHPEIKRVLSEETKIKNRIRARLHRKANATTTERIRKWAKLNPEKVLQSKKQWYSKQKASVDFIAIDGEGITVNDVHYYTLLSSSENHTINNWNKGLTTQQCFEFLYQYAGMGIVVGFGINYDVNMWLRDLSKDQLVTLWNTKTVQWNEWKIDWLKSKMFSLTRNGKRVTVYEVFGYFQASFLRTLVDWNLIDEESNDYQILNENKANRSAFKQSERKQILKYNLLECKLLVQLMAKLREATIQADCLPKSWHGAATIAKALATKYKVADYIEHNERLKIKFLRAYYGGRFQILQQGEFPTAYGHDISSAYPAAMRDLPTSKGKWFHVSEYKPGKQWALYRVQWKTKNSEYLNPFPFRYKSEIYYPNVGEGWYWQPEIEVALKHYGTGIQILEGYVFKPESDVKPFQFINDIYALRMRYKSEGNDAQKALKLGMNSLYGITAQSIGWNGQPPKFQNYFWAGWITSKCRAQVLDLAMCNKSSVIAFATDGVFATHRLTDDVPGLGGWETDEIENLFMLQSGVYSFGFEDNAQPIYKRSRGFSPKSINYDQLRKLWREQGNLGSYSYKETRFIGLGSALPSLKDWRKWKDCEREIDFTISAQVHPLGNSILRILQDQPKCKVSEAYTPHSSWLEKDAAMSQTHDD